jgi:hypothetical protein
MALPLGEQPDMALLAVTHALAAQTFYRAAEAHCLDIRPASVNLASHADGIEDMAAGKALADRHAAWAADLPRDVADLWGFIVGLDQASVMALFAHCASLTINAVKQPWERKPRAHETADKLATALALDMTAHWTPTVRTYLGRVTKAHIAAAVREAVSDEAADRITGMKKQPMAEAAEQLLAGTGWLPSLMRTPEPAWLAAEQPEAVEAEDVPQAQDGDGKPSLMSRRSSLLSGTARPMGPSPRQPPVRRPGHRRRSSSCDRQALNLSIARQPNRRQATVRLRWRCKMCQQSRRNPTACSSTFRKRGRNRDCTSPPPSCRYVASVSSPFPHRLGGFRRLWGLHHCSRVRFRRKARHSVLPGRRKGRQGRSAETNRPRAR